MSRLWSSSYKYFVCFFSMSNLSQTCRLIDWSGRNAWKHRLLSSKIKITLSSSQRYTHTIHIFIYFLFILGPHHTAQVRIERVRAKIPWPPKAKRYRVETSAKCLDPIRPWFFDIYCPENFTSSCILPPWRPAFGVTGEGIDFTLSHVAITTIARLGGGCHSLSPKKHHGSVLQIHQGGCKAGQGSFFFTTTKPPTLPILFPLWYSPVEIPATQSSMQNSKWGPPLTFFF